jgi:predicted P-loop ATPase
MQMGSHLGPGIPAGRRKVHHVPDTRRTLVLRLAARNVRKGRRSPASREMAHRTRRIVGHGKWEQSSLKAFLTRQEDRYRPPYGRSEVFQPRQCVFVGTTNQSDYLKDHTGGRRYWPVVARNIDTVALAADRDQLFAEAVAHFHAGAKWYPDAEFEKTYIRAQQEARFEEDSWEEDIRKTLEGLDRVRIAYILTSLNIDVSHRSTRNERRVSNILQRLGWRPRRQERCAGEHLVGASGSLDPG